MPELSPGERELIERIHWLIRIRWLAAGGVFLAATMGKAFWVPQLHRAPFYFITLIMILYNLLFLGMSRWESAVATPAPSRARSFANLQISVDLIVLTFLLHFSGGVETPLAFYYVFHIIIASILLSPRTTYLQATLAVGLYASLVGLEQMGMIPHHHLAGLFPQELHRQLGFTTLAVTGLATTLYLSVFITTSIAHRLTQKEREVMKLSEELSEVNERLREADRAKSQYLRKVSHELRTPLGAIQSCLKVVLEGLTGEIDPKSREMVERAERRAWELLSILDDLLALSHSREGKLSARRELLSLPAILEKVMGLLRPWAESQGIHLEIHLDPNLPAVRGDPESLEQLFNNLIGNGIKYTPAEGQVEVRVYQKDTLLHVTISDTGIGIPPEAAAKVFDEFYRAENARKFKKEGTGLGLAIVKDILEAHGGHISLCSKPEKGTEFHLTLPGV